jgi:hypothetical protein
MTLRFSALKPFQLNGLPFGRQGCEGFLFLFGIP